MKTKMKNVLAIIVMLIATNTFAQQGDRKPPSIEDRLDHVMTKIEKKIEINESQKTVIKEAFTEFFTSADQEMKPGERPDKSVMDNLEKIRDDKVKTVLSEERFEDYLRLTCTLRPRPNDKNRPGKNGQRRPEPNQ